MKAGLHAVEYSCYPSLHERKLRQANGNHQWEKREVKADPTAKMVEKSEPVFPWLRKHLVSLVKQAFRFGMVGILNTVLTLFIIWFLYAILHMGYYGANAIGYLAGFINSFYWNKNWTFKSGGRPIPELALFILVFGISYGIQVFVLWFFMDLLNVGIVVSQAISMCAYTAVNFLGNRYLTFQEGLTDAD